MKKRLTTFFALFAALLMIAPSLWADTGTVSAPSGKTSTNVPIASNMAAFETQCLYSATQLANATNNAASFKITELHFPFDKAEYNFETNTLNVYCLATDLTTLYNGVSFSSMQQVFSGTIKVNTSQATLDVVLDTPFKMEAGKNLVIGFTSKGKKSYATFKQGESDLSGQSNTYLTNSFNMNTVFDITEHAIYATGTCAALDITYEAEAAGPAFDPATLYEGFTYTPSQEDAQNGFKTMSVTFPNAGMVSIQDDSLITFKSETKTYELGVERSGNTVNIENYFATAKDPGTYTLTFAAGALNAFTSDYVNSGTNPEPIVITWTIESKFDTATLFQDYTLSPSNAAPLETLGSVLKVTFPNAQKIEIDDEWQIVFNDPTGEEISEDVAFSASGNTVEVESVMGAFKKVGTYTLIFRNAALKATYEGSKTALNESDITITWTVKEKYDPQSIFKGYTYTPTAEAAKEGISEITVTFPNAGIIFLNNASGITLADATGKSYYIDVTRSTNTIKCALDKALTDAGTYTLTIAAKALDGYQTADYQNEALNADPITISWTVEAPAFDIASIFQGYTYTPSEEDAKTGISKIDVTFPNALAFDQCSAAKMTLKDAAGADVAFTASVMNKVLTVKPTAEIKTPGTYTLTLNPGALTAYYMDGMVKTGTNPDVITISWTVEAPAFDVTTLFQDWTKTPDADIQTGFKTLEVTFPNAKAIAVEGYNWTFTNPSGAEIDNVSIMPDENTGTNVLTLEVMKKQTAVGTYTLTLAKNDITGYYDGGSAKNSEKIVITWTIEKPIDQAVHFAFTATPAEGSYTDVFSKSSSKVKFLFSEGAQVEIVKRADISVTYPDGSVVLGSSLSNSDLTVYDNGRSVQIWCFDKPFSQTGAYTATIKAGAIKVTLNGATAVNANDLTIHFNCGTAPVDPATLFNDYTVSPANGSEVESLSYANVTFPNLSKIEVADATLIKLTNPSGAEVTVSSNGYGGNTLYNNFEEQKASGTYTLTFAAGALKTANGTEYITNPTELKFSWTIPVDVSALFEFTSSPENGAYVDPATAKNQRKVIFTFNQKAVVEFVNKSEATFINPNGVNVINPTYDVSAAGNYASLWCYDYDYSVLGEYVATIKAGALKVTMDGVSATNPKDLVVKFYSGTAPIDPSLVFADYVVNPENGSEVTEFNGASLQFPNVGKVEFADASLVSLVNPAGEKVTEVTANAYGNTLYYNCNEALKTPGKYTLTFGVGSIKAYNGQDVLTNTEEYVFDWTIAEPAPVDPNAPKVGTVFASSGSTTSDMPVAAYYTYCGSESLYTSSMLATATGNAEEYNITALNYFMDRKLDAGKFAFKVFMAKSDKENLSKGGVDQADMTQVYQGVYTPDGSTDVMTLKLDTPFAMKAGEGLIIGLTCEKEEAAWVYFYYGSGYSSNCRINDGDTSPVTLSANMGYTVNPLALDIQYTLPVENKPVKVDLVAVGTERTPDAPYWNPGPYSGSQTLYTAAEVAAATNNADKVSITELEYTMDDNYTDKPSEITAYYALTDKTDLASGIAQADLTQVYTGLFAPDGTSNKMTLKLSTPIVYESGKNLVIAIKAHKDDANIGGWVYWRYGATREKGTRLYPASWSGNPKEFNFVPENGEYASYIPSLAITYEVGEVEPQPEPDVFDLAAESVTAPETVVAGQPYEYEVKVRNTGNKPQSAYTVNVYTVTADGNTTIGTAVVTDEEIEAGFANTVKVTCTLPAAGTYTVGASVFSENDEDAANNNVAETVTVKAIKLDVTAVSMTAPATAALDESVEFKLTVKNDGDAANKDYKVSVVSVNAEGFILKTLAEVTSVPEVAANSEATITIPYTFGLAGNYMLKGIVSVEGFDDTMTLPAEVAVSFDKLPGNLELTVPAGIEAPAGDMSPINYNVNKFVSQILYTADMLNIERGAEIHKLGFTMLPNDYKINIPVKIQVASVADVTALSASALVSEDKFVTVYDNIWTAEVTNEDSNVMFELGRPFVLKEGENLVVMVTTLGSKDAVTPYFGYTNAEYACQAYMKSNAADVSEVSIYTASNVYAVKKLPILSLDYALEPLPPVVDMKVNSLTADPTETVTGADVTFRAEIENIGTVDVAEFTLELLDMADAENPVVLKSVTIDDAYGAGAQVTEKVKYAFAEAGEYKVAARVVVADDVDTANNISDVVTVKVETAPVVDLAVNALEASAEEVEENSEVVFTATVENKGNVTAKGFKLELVDMANAENPQVLAETTVNTELAAGETADYGVAYTFATAGDYKLAVRVVYEDDSVADNNISDIVEVKVKQNDGVNGLYASDSISYNGNDTLILPEGAEHVLVADVQGRVFANVDLNGANAIELHLNANVYIVSVQLANGRSMTARIIVK